MKNIFSLILFLLALVALSSSHILADNIIIQSSTSLKNSGFYRFLAPILKQHTDVEIRVVAVGTGQAIKNMKKIVLFASGGGSSVENILRSFVKEKKIKVSGIFCNNQKAGLLKRVYLKKFKTIITLEAVKDTGYGIEVPGT